jgi:hypothetical protein
MPLPDKSGDQPKRKVAGPVVSTSKLVSRPASRRFFDFVFADSPKELLKRVAINVIVPRAKAGLEEAANSFLSGMLWGDASKRPASNIIQGTVIRGGSVNYAALSNSQNPSMLAAKAAGPSSAGNYKDVVFGSLADAEIVLANMYELLNEYRIVAVGDLYELAGQPTTPSDNAYGWTALDGARISQVARGYVLELPRPSLI